MRSYLRSVCGCICSTRAATLIMYTPCIWSYCCLLSYTVSRTSNDFRRRANQSATRALYMAQPQMAPKLRGLSESSRLDVLYPLTHDVSTRYNPVISERPDEYRLSHAVAAPARSASQAADTGHSKKAESRVGGNEMLYFKACPRCKGDVHRDRGRVRRVPQVPAVRPHGRPGQDPGAVDHARPGRPHGGPEGEGGVMRKGEPPNPPDGAPLSRRPFSLSGIRMPATGRAKVSTGCSRSALPSRDRPPCDSRASPRSRARSLP